MTAKTFEIAAEDIKIAIARVDKLSWGNTPYLDRQVYAASSNVPVEICLECPYFKSDDMGNQPGICCYCRSEAKDYGMKGDALCVLYLLD